MSVYDILMKIGSTTKRNEKLAILNEHKDNELLKTVIKYTLDPHKQFYIRKIPEYESSKTTTVNELEALIPLLDDLSDRTVTGNNAIDHLKYILSSLSKEDAYVVERIIAKDLGCGISTATVNKVWSGLISEFPCMLCSAYSDKLFDTFDFPAIIQEKLDGMRAVIIKKGDTIDIRSRNGKPIDLLGSLDDEVSKIEFFGDFVLDGEFLVTDSSGNVLPRKIGNGILNKANKGTITKKEADNVIYIVWDSIPLDDWLQGYCNKPYMDRFNDLLSSLIFNTRIMIPATKTVDSKKDAISFYKYILKQGGEGAILKQIDSPWENKRSKQQMKMKLECEIDLVVVDMIEGTNKYTGKLGALVCESSDGKVRVNVGSGFSDKQRKEFWSDSSLIGKVVTIKVNDLIEAEGRDTLSLFLPVFVEVREDKDKADSLEKIENEFSTVKAA